MTSKLKLESGKTYINRVGEHVTVVYQGADDMFSQHQPFIDRVNKHRFCENGKYLITGPACPYDLIGEVELVSSATRSIAIHEVGGPVTKLGEMSLQFNSSDELIIGFGDQTLRLAVGTNSVVVAIPQGRIQVEPCNYGSSLGLRLTAK